MIYRIRRIIGILFNLAVWQIIFIPPNLNNTISGSIANFAVMFTNSYSLSPNCSDAKNDFQSIRQIFDSPTIQHTR